MAASSADPESANETSTSLPLTWPITAASMSCPSRKRSPATSFRAGRAKARQTPGPNRRCSRSSTFAGRASSARASLRPLNLAGITLELLVINASPRRRNFGKSATKACCNSPLWCTTNRRAVSRGTAGRRAIRSSGRSKSKRETSMGRALYRRAVQAPAKLEAVRKDTVWQQMDTNVCIRNAIKLTALTYKGSFVPLTQPRDALLHRSVDPKRA